MMHRRTGRLLPSLRLYYQILLFGDKGMCAYNLPRVVTENPQQLQYCNRLITNHAIE